MRALVVAFVLVFAVAPLTANADVYVNAPGFTLKSYSNGCEHYGQGAKCSDRAVGEGRTSSGVQISGGASLNFQIVDSAPACDIPNFTGHYRSCHIFQWCVLGLTSHYSAVGNLHYDISHIHTSVGEPGDSPGTIHTGSQFPPQREACTATWVNGNTVKIDAKPLPRKPAGMEHRILCDKTPAYKTATSNELYAAKPEIAKGTILMLYYPIVNGRVTTGTYWVSLNCIRPVGF